MDRYQEYTEFMKIRAQLVKRKWRRKLRDNAWEGVFLNVEDLGNTFNDLMIRAQTILGKRIVNLGSTVNKWVFAISVLSRMVGRVLLITLLGMGLVSLLNVFEGSPISFALAAGQVIQNKLYQGFLIVALVFRMAYPLSPAGSGLKLMTDVSHFTLYSYQPSSGRTFTGGYHD